MTAPPAWMSTATVAAAQSAALFGTTSMPLWIVTMIVDNGWSPALAGLAGTCEYLGIAVAAAFFARVAPAASLAILGRLGFIGAGSGNLLCAVAADPALLLVGRLLAGVGAGALMVASARVAAGSPNPSRTMAWAMLANGATVVVAFLALPALLAAAGPSALFTALALAVVPAAVALERLPGHDLRHVHGAARKPHVRLLAVALLLQVTSAMVWPYIGAFGSRVGVSLATLGGWIAGGAVIAGTLPLAVSLLGTQFSRPAVLAVVAGAMLVATVVVILAPSAAVLAAGIGGLMIALAFMGTSLIPIVSRHDRTGATPALLPTTSNLGKTIGPLLGGAIYGFGQGAALAAAVALCCGAAAVVALVVDRRRECRAPTK